MKVNEKLIKVGSKSELMEALEDIKEEILSSMQPEQTRVEVGKLSQDLVDKFNFKQKQEEILLKRKEARLEELALDAMEIIKNEFGELEKKLEKDMDDLWEQVYSELNLSNKGNYSFNRKTGCVVEFVPINKVTKPTLVQ